MATITSPIFFSVNPRRNIHKPYLTSLFLSTTSTPYPLQYDMIINRPTQQSFLSKPVVDLLKLLNRGLPDSADPEFDSWVDNKLALEREKGLPGSGDSEMDKAKRKYYSKQSSLKSDEGFVELKPEVVEFDRLHQREEELYFYDAFAYLCEKDKHYKMVYQLEKKYFPDQCLDKAFLQPVETSKKADDSGKVGEKKKKVVALGGKRNVVKGIGMEKCDEDDDSGYKLVFFEAAKEEEKKEPVEEVVSEKKVEQFFKGLTKSPNEKGLASGVGDGQTFPCY